MKMYKYSAKIMISRFIMIYNIDFFYIPKLKIIKHIINKIFRYTFVNFWNANIVVVS